jgi:hypothetical protein
MGRASPLLKRRGRSLACILFSQRCEPNLPAHDCLDGRGPAGARDALTKTIDFFALRQPVGSVTFLGPHHELSFMSFGGFERSEVS